MEANESSLLVSTESVHDKIENVLSSGDNKHDEAESTTNEMTIYDINETCQGHAIVRTDSPFLGGTDVVGTDSPVLKGTDYVLRAISPVFIEIDNVRTKSPTLEGTVNIDTPVPGGTPASRTGKATSTVCATKTSIVSDVDLPISGDVDGTVTDTGGCDNPTTEQTDNPSTESTSIPTKGDIDRTTDKTCITTTKETDTITTKGTGTLTNEGTSTLTTECVNASIAGRTDNLTIEGMDTSTTREPNILTMGRDIPPTTGGTITLRTRDTDTPTVGGNDTPKVGEAETLTVGGSDTTKEGGTETPKEGGTETSKDGGSDTLTVGGTYAPTDGGSDTSPMDKMNPTTIGRIDDPTRDNPMKRKIDTQTTEKDPPMSGESYPPSTEEYDTPPIGGTSFQKVAGTNVSTREGIDTSTTGETASTREGTNTSAIREPDSLTMGEATFQGGGIAKDNNSDVEMDIVVEEEKILRRNSSISDQQGSTTEHCLTTESVLDSKPYPTETFDLLTPTMDFPDIFLDAQEAQSPHTDKQLISDVDMEVTNAVAEVPPFFPRVADSPTDMELVPPRDVRTPVVLSICDNQSERCEEVKPVVISTQDHDRSKTGEGSIPEILAPQVPVIKPCKGSTLVVLGTQDHDIIRPCKKVSVVIETRDQSEPSTLVACQKDDFRMIIDDADDLRSLRDHGKDSDPPTGEVITADRDKCATSTDVGDMHTLDANMDIPMDRGEIGADFQMDAVSSISASRDSPSAGPGHVSEQVLVDVDAGINQEKTVPRTEVANIADDHAQDGTESATKLKSPISVHEEKHRDRSDDLSGPSIKHNLAPSESEKQTSSNELSLAKSDCNMSDSLCASMHPQVPSGSVHSECNMSDSLSGEMHLQGPAGSIHTDSNTNDSLCASMHPQVPSGSIHSDYNTSDSLYVSINIPGPGGSIHTDSNTNDSLCASMHPEAPGGNNEHSVPPSLLDTESSNLSYVSASTSTTQPLDAIVKAGIDADDMFLPGEGPNPADVSTVHKAAVDHWCTQQASMSEHETEPTDAKIKFNPDNIPLEYEETEFDWEEYMEDTNSSAAPHTAFSHVETSLRSNFEKGMKFEVPHSEPVCYWIATVMMPCGQLLRLRYDGNDGDGSKDFWSDAFTSDIHPLGWCKQNNKSLVPPDDVKELLPDWQAYIEKTLEQATTASDKLLGGGLGTAAVDQIKQGMLVEIQHRDDLTQVWIARILENIGGRLLLRYEGTDSARQDFWLFYLHNRIHPMGWAQDMDMQYGPPEVVVEEWSRDEGWKAVLEKAQSETKSLPFPDEVLADQEMVLDHTFKEGWRLEVLHPVNKNTICPATVAQVFSDLYFLVKIDNLCPSLEESPVQVCCHGGSRNIFPINWSMDHEIRIQPPNGWEKEFIWSDYLAEMAAERAPPDAFCLDCGTVSLAKGMRLEAASPEQPGQISVATVTRVCEPLVQLHLESSPSLQSFHMVDCQSHEIFPVGWCESNNYPLKPPHRAFFTRRQKKQSPSPITPKSTESSQRKPSIGDKGSSWCPKIYFNHRCFSGPYLSKGRIAELPKCVGPGPVTLVMKEVLSMLINVAYKSSRVLREIQLDGPADPSLHQQVLKAKYKGKSYRAMVELCKSSDQVVDFCHNVCVRLECCPYLFNPIFVNGQCPENCSQQSKTKYTAYVGKKKKKVGRPPGGHTNLEGGAKKPGKRRKRKRINFLKVKKSLSSITVSQRDEDYDELESMLHDQSSNSTVASLDLALVDGDSPRRKRKYTRHVAPPLEMKTRGVKLPRYSMERRARQPRISMETDLVTQTNVKTTPRKQRSRKSAFVSLEGEDSIVLDTNPLFWSIPEVCDYIKTTDCAPLVRLFREEEIDGQALLLLTLPTVQEIMEVKLGPAIKLCHLIEKLQIAFYQQYAVKM